MSTTTERTPLLQDIAPDASASTTRASSISETPPKNVSPTEVEEGTARTGVPVEPPVKPFRELLLTVRMLHELIYAPTLKAAPPCLTGSSDGIGHFLSFDGWDYRAIVLR